MADYKMIQDILGQIGQLNSANQQQKKQDPSLKGYSLGSQANDKLQNMELQAPEPSAGGNISGKLTQAGMATGNPVLAGIGMAGSVISGIADERRAARTERTNFQNKGQQDMANSYQNIINALKGMK